MNKLYVLVREDLSRAQRAVQAGHAVAEWCWTEASRWRWDGREVTTPAARWTNGTLVYLGVRGEQELSEWAEKLGSRGVCWREPYWQNQLTAVAVLGGEDPFEFAALDLLRF